MNLRQENYEFEVSLCCIARHCLKNKISWAQWLIPIIPATWEAEIGRIMVGGQPII
jgi:hypothetical protein